MELASLRYWQWIVIGLVIGSLVGYAWVGVPGAIPRSGDLNTFRALVRDKAAQEAQGKVERLRGVTVFAPETNPSGIAVYPVVYTTLVPDKDGKPAYEERGINAKTPFEGKELITDYLTRNKVKFSDRTGNGQYLPIGYGAGAGVLLIGLLWPTMIRLLVTAGFAPPPKEKTEKPKAYASGKMEDKSIIKPGSRAVTGADMKNLDALNDNMEQRLAAGASAGGNQTKPAPIEEPISTLMTGTGSRSTIDPTAAVAPPSEPGKPKDYKGEWYPVARPAVKKDEK